MDSKWSFEDAREHLDEVVRRAHESGPQVLTEHGEESAVVLSCEEYARLRGAPARTKGERTGRDLIELLRNSPLLGVDDLEAVRNRELPGRPPDLTA